MILIDAFLEGGWFMYPILASGLTLVVSTVHRANFPSPQRDSLVRHLRATTLSLGLFGSLLGVVHALAGLAPPPPADSGLSLSVIKGICELINCTGQALVWLIASSIISSAGDFRASRSAAS